MTDLLEDLLVRDLATAAEDVPGARIDAAAVRRVAGRERRHRRVVALAAAAALVVGVTGVATRGDTGGDVPLAAHDLPAGGALKLPWTTPDDTLHVDGRAVVVPGLVAAVHRGSTTLVATQSKQGDALEWSRYRPGLEGGRLVPLGPVGSGQPSLSPDGRWVAWGDGSSASMLDVTTGKRAVVFVRTTTGGDVEVDSVDRLGRAVLVMPGGDRPRVLWAHGADLVPLTDLPGDVGSVHLLRGDLVAVDDHVSRTSPRLYRLSPSGAVSLVGDLAGHGREPLFNAVGSAYVTVVGDDLAFAVLRRDGSSSLGSPLGLPGEGTSWAVAGWEDRDHLVFSRENGTGMDLVRCSVSTDGCESVPSKGVWSLLGYE